MTEEQIKRKAKTYSKNYWYNTNNSVNVASIEKLLIDFATETTKELEEQIEEMKRYIKACWIEENINDYSSYITNTSDEFRDLVEELNAEVRNER